MAMGLSCVSLFYKGILESNDVLWPRLKKIAGELFHSVFIDLIMVIASCLLLNVYNMSSFCSHQQFCELVVQYSGLGSWVGKPQILREQLLRLWAVEPGSGSECGSLFLCSHLTHAFVCQVARLGRCGLSSQ